MIANRPLFLFAASLALGWASTAAAGPAEKCEAAKLKASGNQAKCLLQAQADSVKSGSPADTTQCVANFEAAFAAAEGQYGLDCPTLGDVDAIETLVDACRNDVASALSGSPSPPRQNFPATGQTTVYQTGDDGDLQAGATLSYTDNGDGTVTDDNTRLTWEKKSDDGSIHDKDNTYSWDNAYAVHVAGLNAAKFAGHDDWRLPNVKELQSIVNYGTFRPAVSSAFNTNCVANGTVLTGSCSAFVYWSSTTLATFQTNAWFVFFTTGGVEIGDTVTRLPVRAVRGGSP